MAHKRVHTKERPYNCQFPGCDMRFTKSHHVKRHYETHFKYGRGEATGAGASIAATLTAATCSPLSSSLISSFAFPTV